MPRTTEDVKNELTGLQYSVDQIQLSKINIDLLLISNAPLTKELIENNEINIFPENDEIESFLHLVEEVKNLDGHINNQLNDYLELFPPNQQSDFHFMLDALQNFVEWSEDYANKVKSFETAEGSEKQLEEFRTSSEFVSLCCNWMSSTVSTVLKYGFDSLDDETV